jgi:hypothetical protein
MTWIRSLTSYTPPLALWDETSLDDVPDTRDLGTLVLKPGNPRDAPIFVRGPWLRACFVIMVGQELEKIRGIFVVTKKENQTTLIYSGIICSDKTKNYVPMMYPVHSFIWKSNLRLTACLYCTS